MKATRDELIMALETIEDALTQPQPGMPPLPAAWRRWLSSIANSVLAKGRRRGMEDDVPNEP